MFHITFYAYFKSETIYGVWNGKLILWKRQIWFWATVVI